MTKSSEADLSLALAAVVSRELGVPDVGIRGLVRLSGGASRQTWSFDAAVGGDVHPLILRLAPTTETDGELMLLEAAAMREAARVGVPEPAVLAAAADLTELGASYVVMERIDGETIPRRILRDDTYAEARPLLATQCGTILAKLHQMDVATLPSLIDIDPIDALRELLVATGAESPTMELALRWLTANQPTPTRKVVVHGDFRNGNLIIGPEGVRAVLDWELVHLGDPMEDLGWLCVRAWRFGGRGPVGGFGSYEDLFAAYGAASGLAVDPIVVRWWELYGAVRWGVICVMQASRHLSGAQQSVELATIGRRLAEQEYDCLNLLDELVDR